MQQKIHPLKEKLNLIILALLLITIGLEGCAPATPFPTASATETASPAQVTAQSTEIADPFYTIGFSEALNPSNYRSQMLADLMDVSEEYKNSHLLKELILDSTGSNIDQAEQIQNLIDKKVNAILVYPGDTEALKPVLQKAVQDGILVLSVGAEIDLPGVYSVAIDQSERSITIARWLIDTIGAQGAIAQITLNPASPESAAQEKEFNAILSKYPEAKITSTIEVPFQSSAEQQTEATKQAFLKMFTQSPLPSGVLSDHGTALGALQALIELKPAGLPILTGDPNCSYMTLWKDVLTTDPGFQSIIVADPPGATAATAMRIAVAILQGKTVNPAALGGKFGTTFIVPNMEPITLDNFEQQFFLQCMGKSIQFEMDKIMTVEEIANFFKK